MAIEKFTIEKIGDIEDGQIAETINKYLASVVQDCLNRPGLDKARSIGIKLSFTPAPDDRRVCREIQMSVASSITIPKSESKMIELAVGPSGLLFNPASLDNVNQRTLDELDGGEAIDRSTGEVTLRVARGN